MKFVLTLFLAVLLILTGALSGGAGMDIPAGTPPPGAENHTEDSQRLSMSGLETIVPEGARISNDYCRASTMPR